MGLWKYKVVRLGRSPTASLSQPDVVKAKKRLTGGKGKCTVSKAQAGGIYSVKISWLADRNDGVRDPGRDTVFEIDVLVSKQKICEGIHLMREDWIGRMLVVYVYLYTSFVEAYKLSTL